MLNSFFGDEVLKVETHANLVAARKAGAIEQGGCRHRYEMQRTCAIAVTVQRFPTQYGDYVTILGLPTLLAEVEENIFERLSHDEAVFFPERVIEAIGVGCDLSTIGWALLQATILEHEGLGHRLVTKIVTACARYLDPLIAGGRVDSIDARELADEAARVARLTVTATRGDSHPAHDVVLIAQGAMLAAASTLQHKNAVYDVRMEDTCHRIILDTLKPVIESPGGATEMAERLIRLLHEASSENLIKPDADRQLPYYGASSPVQLDERPKARAKTRRARVESA